VVGIEFRRASCRWRVTKPALSIASWVLISTMATFSKGRVGPGNFTPSLPQIRTFLRLPVDSILIGVTCPLRSTGITPLPRYYEAVRPWSVLQYFRPRGSSTCAFSLGITDPVLKFRTKARIRVMPPLHRTPHGQ
jgi:hypothetical protein